MSLLDDVVRRLGAIAGSQEVGGVDRKAGDYAGGFDGMAVLPMLMSQSGGIKGLLQKFEACGLADTVNSWVIAGPNLPVSVAQIKAVLGDAPLHEMAAQLGVDAQYLASQLARHLPCLIDNATPYGQIPDGRNILGETGDFLGVL
jgi:uncharacterized protein YidB (DUF937 family)